MTPENFWERTAPQPNGCVDWIGPLHPDGYGQVWMRGFGSRQTHRAAWVIANGAIPSGLWVLHRCNNRRCVNPDHLYLGTAADNGHDLAARIASEKGAST